MPKQKHNEGFWVVVLARRRVWRRRLLAHLNRHQSYVVLAPWGWDLSIGTGPGDRQIGGCARCAQQTCRAVYSPSSDDLTERPTGKRGTYR